MRYRTTTQRRQEDWTTKLRRENEVLKDENKRLKEKIEEMKRKYANQ